jgi:hypothetical protein
VRRLTLVLVLPLVVLALGCGGGATDTVTTTLTMTTSAGTSGNLPKCSDTKALRQLAQTHQDTIRCIK